MAEHVILGSAWQGSKEGGEQSRKQEGAVAVEKCLPEVGLEILLSWYSACRMKVFTPNPALGRWRLGYHKFKVILCYTVISRLLEILSYKGGGQ